jgi:Tfp pilus assembly protein PilF
MNGTPGTRAKGSAALCLAIVAAAGMLAGCPGNDAEAPKRDPDRYRKMVSAFYTGLVALEANDPKRAEANLTEATQLFPNEPAAWADLALFYFRATQQDRAAKALEKAQSAAGNNSDIQLLAALLQEQSNPQKAAELTQKAIQVDPHNLKARAKLADLLERLAAPDAPQKIMEQY